MIKRSGRWFVCEFPFIVIVSLSLVSCQTTPTEEVEPEIARPYYCPFRSDSNDLTAWANNAIQRGIGLRVHPELAPYPDNRYEGDYAKLTREQMEKEGKAMTETVARMVGGWTFIDETSDQKYETVDELALVLYSQYSSNPRYAEALNATMMLYPTLRAAYYPTAAGTSLPTGATNSRPARKKSVGKKKKDPDASVGDTVVNEDNGAAQPAE